MFPSAYRDQGPAGSRAIRPPRRTSRGADIVSEPAEPAKAPVDADPQEPLP